MNSVKFLATAAAMTMLLFCGCSDQSNPVAPSQVTVSAPAAPLARLDGMNGMCLDPGSATGWTNIISTSARISAKNGGTASLTGTYMGPNGKLVWYDLSVSFVAGALPVDTTITISIDKTTFQENGLVTFEPHGLEFSKPGVLSLKAQGVSIAESNTTLNLYYLNNGVFEQMPKSWGSFATKNFGHIQAGAKIPHFSRYAFGR